MNLLSIEDTSVIYLMQATRPSGQMYAPQAVVLIRDRYGFVKIPSVDELTKSPQVFSIGQFQGAQIQEFQIYGDGIIVKSRSNTSIMDAFLADFMQLLEKEMGIVFLDVPAREQYYESAVVIQSEIDIVYQMRPRIEIDKMVTKRLERPGYVPATFKAAAFGADVEVGANTGRRKPVALTIERRIGIPYARNIFYSTAPLKTDDHLRLLRDVESEVSALR